MPFHGTRAQEELCGDLGIGVTVARQPGNLLLLSREVVARLRAPLSDSFAGSGQFAAGVVHERLHSNHDKHAVCRTKLLAGVDAVARSAQPLAVQQVRTGKLRAQRCLPNRSMASW